MTNDNYYGDYTNEHINHVTNIDLLYHFLETSKSFNDGLVSIVLKQFNEEADMPTWKDCVGAIDALIRDSYKFRQLFSYLTFNTFDPPPLRNLYKIFYMVDAVLKKNNYKYDKLFKTLNLEYNPIENYSMTETEEITGSNSGTVKTDLGAKTDTRTENYGARTKNVSDVIGAVEKTVNSNSGTTEKTLSVSPSDEVDVFYGKEKNLENQSKNATSTENTGTQTNTSSENENAFINSYDLTSGATSNTETRDLSDTQKRTLKRSGNVGVTTSQQMAESERQLAMFSFIELVAQDVANEITIGIWDLL